MAITTLLAGADSGATAAASTQRRMQVTSNGYIVVLLITPTNTATFRISTDGGATWTTLFTQGSVLNGSFVIDEDDYLNFVWKVPGGNIVSKRGAPNASRTAWTFGADLAVRGDASAVNFPDLVVFRHPAGGWQQIVLTSHDSGSACLYKLTGNRLLAATPTTYEAANIDVDGPIQAAGQHARGSIDFRHTGDGRTTSGIPDVFFTYSAGTSNMRFRKGTWTGTTWTWGTETSYGNAYVGTNASLGMKCLWDGTKVYLGGFAYNVSGWTLQLFSRDLADTAYVQHHVSLYNSGLGGAFGPWVYATRDGNVHIVGRGHDGGTAQVQRYTYNQAANTWTGPTQLVAPASVRTNNAYPVGPPHQRTQNQPFAFMGPSVDGDVTFPVMAESTSHPYVEPSPSVQSSASAYGSRSYGGSARIVVASPVFTDDFNRADSDIIGNGWTEQGGNWAIEGNRLKVTGNDGVLTRSFTSVNATMQVTIVSGAADQGFVVRWASAGNYLMVRPNDAFLVSGGGYNGISGGNTSEPFVAGDVFKIDVEGTTLRKYRNGVLYFTHVLTGDYATSTTHGLWGRTATPFFDDYSIATVGTPLPTPPTTFTDDFNRADDAALVGYTKRIGNGTLTLTGNKIVNTGTNYNSMVRAQVNKADGSLDISADFTGQSESVDAAAGFAYNVQSNGDGYMLAPSARYNQASLYRANLSTLSFTLVAHVNTDVPSAYTLRVTRVGNTHTVFINGTQRGTYTDSYVPNSGQAGLMGFSSWSADNLAMGDAAAPPPPPSNVSATIVAERATTSVAAPAGDVLARTIMEGQPATIWALATPGQVAAADNSYPGYDDGYEPGGVSPNIVIGGLVSAATLTAPQGSLAGGAVIAGPSATITLAPGTGVLSTGVNLSGPLASEVFIWTAHPGRVEASSSVPIDISLAGPLATILYAAPLGTLATSSGTGGAMPKGVAATVVLRAHPGDVAIGPATFVPGGATTGEVAGGVATIVLTAPAGVLVTSPPNLAGPKATILLKAPLGDVAAYTVNRAELVLTLSLIDTTVPIQPGTLRVQVGNGTPYGTVYFFLNGAATHFASSVLDDAGSATVALPINNLAVGTHAVRASATTTLPTASALNNKSFTVSQAPAPTDPTPTPVTPPIPAPAPVDHWVFQAYNFTDINNIETYVLPVNPETYAPAYGGFAINSEPTSVSNGNVISWEGRPPPEIFRWSGRSLTKEQYLALEKLSQVNQRVWITDHFRRRFLVKISNLRYQRVRDRQRPWHHTYECEAWLLSGEGLYV